MSHYCVWLLLFQAVSFCVLIGEASRSVSSKKVVSVFAAGFDESPRTVALLEGLVSAQKKTCELPIVYQTGQTDSNDSIYLVVDTEIPGSISGNRLLSDVAMSFLDSSDMLNENVVISRLQGGFRALLGPGTHIGKSKVAITNSTVSNSAAGSPGWSRAAAIRKPYIVAFTGPASLAGKVEQLLRKAWQLLDKDDLFTSNAAPGVLSISNKTTTASNDLGALSQGLQEQRWRIKYNSLFALFDVQIVIVPFSLGTKPLALSPAPFRSESSSDLPSSSGISLNPEAVTAINKVLVSSFEGGDCSKIWRTLDEELRLRLNGKTGDLVVDTVQKTSSEGPGSDGQWSRGFETLQVAVADALRDAVQHANESLKILNMQQRPAQLFAAFTEQLVVNASAAVGERVSLLSPPISDLAKQLAQNELAHKLYVRMAPLFQHQVKFLRTDAIAAFNVLVDSSSSLDELELAPAGLSAPKSSASVFLANIEKTVGIRHGIRPSVFVLDDLCAVRDATMRVFVTEVDNLKPKLKGSLALHPTQWAATLETFELRRCLDDYINGQESLYRALGVLPRNTKVVDGTDSVNSVEVSAVFRGENAFLDITRLKALQFVSNFVQRITQYLPRTDISIHVLATHPFGSDYRQDVVLLEKSKKRHDILLYDPQSIYKHSFKILPAYEIRNAFVKGKRIEGPVAATTFLGLPSYYTLKRHLIRHQANKKSEFAREMMMLPVSLKSPELSILQETNGGGGSATEQFSKRRSQSNGVNAALEGHIDRTLPITVPER
jgi:hypothetical protein